MASVTRTSSLFESPLSPNSSHQWKKALQEIKLLYIRRQYKQCASRSSEILNTATEPIHPIHKTYLYFYSAISYEGMGRSTHKYSKNKLSQLHSALDCFLTCSAVLPDPIDPPSESDHGSPSVMEESSSSDFSGTPSSIASLVSGITDIIEKAIHSEDDDPFISDQDTPCKVPPSQSGKRPLIPSPLKVRKVSEDLDSWPRALRAMKKATNPADEPGKIHRPPPLPFKILPLGATNNSHTDSSTRIISGDSQRSSSNATVDTSPMTPPRAAAVNRYNNSIQFLHSQIRSSISAIHTLIDEVTEVQQARRASKTIRRSVSFWSFSPVKEGCEGKSGGFRQSPAKETKEQRIARLRADGWNTVGLRCPIRGWKGSEHYKSYCSSVLDELYLAP